MTTKLVAALSAALLLLSISATASAFAVDNNIPLGTDTKETLKGKGYTCEFVSTNFWECTKPGEPTYWCDASSCQVKLKLKGTKLGGIKLNNIGPIVRKHP